MLLNLKELIHKYGLKINGILHIGAHWGEENSLYDEIGISNRIYFEPLSKNFSILSSKLFGKFECIRTALGNQVGEIEMNVEEANNGQSSSILNPKIHLLQYPHIKFVSKEIVPITKLDLVPFDRKSYNFINVDVQGYELEVFKGSSKTLETIDYIISEVNCDEVYEKCVKVTELDSYLKNYGFSRLDTTWDGLTWGDAFYAKTSV